MIRCLDADALQVVAADDGKGRGGRGVVADHAVGIQGPVDRKDIAVAAGDPRDGGVEVVFLRTPDCHATADIESLRVFDGNLLLAEVAIDGQRRDDTVGLAKDCFVGRAADSDEGPQVKGIAHEVVARADLDGTAAKPGDIVHGRLQGAVVAAEDVGLGLADFDQREILHGRVHPGWQLPFVGTGGVVHFLRIGHKGQGGYE